MQIYQPTISGSLELSGSANVTGSLNVSGSITLNGSPITTGGTSAGASKGFAIAMAAAL